MNIQGFKEFVFNKAEAEGFEQYELYYTENEIASLSVYKSKPEKFSQSETCGVGFRGIYRGKMGYCYSEIMSEDAAEFIVKEAKNNAMLNEDEREEFIFGGSDSYSELNVYNHKLAELSVDDRMELALRIEKAALEYDERISGVNKTAVNYSCASKFLANSKGLELKEKSNYIIATVEVVARSGESIKEKFDLFIGNDIEKFEPEKLGRAAAEKAVSALNGKAVSSGDYKVIFNNEVFADILSCFCGNFSADVVQKGFSLLKGKLNDRIASQKISLIDDALMENGCATTAFDSEGVACTRKKIIDGGILKTFLYNLKTAGADGKSSTGNGFKGSFKGSVGVSPTNLYIEKGNLTFDELLNALDKGIVITDVTGLHSGANTVSGDFSLAAEGFTVENGRLDKPIEQITVSGNFYELLKEAKEVGSDLKFSGSVGSPSVLFEKIHISGL